ncbi:MAG: NAD(P)/FAD-dependent oxidoreductase [Patescibacteria group bacterium]
MSHHPVVIIGGGFAGVYTAQGLLKRNIPVTLVSETNHFTFTPLLHEVATGSLIAYDAMFEYEGFFHSKHFRFVRGRVTGIDRATKQVEVKDERIPYRFLVLAPGSTTNFYSIKGTEHAYTLKSIEDAVKLKRAILSRAQDADRHVAVTVVGGGPTGLELIFDIHQLLGDLKRKSRTADYDLRLVHATETFCRGGGDQIQGYISDALKRTKIEVICGATASAITPNSVETSAGTFHSDVTILCAGVRPNTDFLKETMNLDPQGHVPVAGTLQSLEDPHVFALGDVIAIDDQPVPKLAQLAVREAQVVAQNVAALCHNPHANLRGYRPKVIGTLFSLGYGDGVGTIGKVMVKGVLAWYLWRTVYLFKTPGLWNKLRVAFSWTLGLFQGRNVSEL